MGGEETRLEEYRQMLQSLKGTAEGLLISQVSNVWNIYGGLNRLHHVMENIFKHGCRVFNQDGDPDCWIFIQGLSWLNPSLAVSPTFLAEVEEIAQQLPPNIHEKALVWLYKSLEGHTLSQKLSWLLSDREHLLSCFEKSAFLCQEKYGEATLICLRAVEQNQPSLLTEIDPCLYLTAWNYKAFQKTHRRCSSFPETQYNAWHMGRSRGIRLMKQPSTDSQLFTAMTSISNDSPPLGNAESSVNSDKDVMKCERTEEDNRSLCEEVTECTFENSNVDVRVDTPSENIQDAESASDTRADEVDTVHKVKRWVSLPCLVDSDTDSGFRDRSLTVNVRDWTATEKESRYFGSGSRTLPSSPTKLLSKFSSSRCPRQSCSSEHSTYDTSTSVSEALPLSPCSKLSPSVLEIDYMSELQSDNEHGSSTFQKCNRNWRTVHVSSVSKGAISKTQIITQNGSSVKTKLAAIKKSPVPTNIAIASSGSSDTLNLEVNKSSNESLMKSSHPSTSKGSSALSKPNVRPSELKLTTRTWDETDGSCTEPQSSWSMENGRKQDLKLKRRKSGIVGSAPEYAGEWLNDTVVEKRPYKKSFIEDGGSSVLPMSTGFFPRPVEGQSLTSFLSSGQFARPSAELDRENAHFSISEAMIAAIEQVKCNRQLRVAEERGEVGDESDEEINHLKQRIRLRRRQRQEEKQTHLWGVSLLSDGKTDTTTTDQSISPLSSSPGTPSESISTDDVDDLEVDEVKNLSQLKHAGMSVSMASLYSEADLSKHPPPRTGTDLALTESVVSAEGVALSLLRQFSEKQLPRASDLQWLVSEQDAPQQLLPLPTSWPVSPDEAEDADMRQATPLRGTMEWAPPRPQVIFTPHPTPVRRVLMAKQNYRCAGCGMKVAAEYAHRFRYCEYLGRYFCTGCHTNQLALIPGRILTKWDFTRCSVSNFSYRLLDQMMSDPLFRIGDLNMALYRKARQLERTRQLRLQLYYLKNFVLTCRFAEMLQEELKKEAEYLLIELDVYSMQDLVQVKSGEMPTRLRELVSSSSQHVAECELCQARGFVCELCASQEVIYPWLLGKVTRCASCGACFHTACWTPSPCPRCTRLSARRQSRSDDL